MKPLKIFLIILGWIILSVSGTIIGTRVIPKTPVSWWWTIGLILFYVFIGMVVGLILLIRKVIKKKPEEIKANINEAEAYAKNKLIYDDNPDNFIREDKILMRVGSVGTSITDRTPILWLIGSGSETKNKIDILINLKNPKEEILFLYNKKEEYIRKVIEQFAENPKEIIETEVIPGLDDFGRPQNRVVTRKVSSSQKKEEEKKEDAKVGNAY
jgi:hypothetical protein